MKAYLLLLAFIVVAMPQVASEEEAKPANPQEKVYVIYTRGSSAETGGGVVVTRLEKEEFLGVACLKGMGLDSYTRGIPIRLPVENIVMIMEFDGEAAWEKAIREYKQLDGN